MRQFNPEYQTSEGTYFKDPVTLRDLTRDELRVSGPNPEDTGPFNWPRVKVSNGDVVKIAFRLFNDVERQCYKAYRSRGKQRVSAPRQKSEATEPTPRGRAYEVERVEVEGIPNAPAATTKAVIANCDQYCGTCNIGGLYYSILSVRGSDTMYYVPKALVSSDDMIRLCNKEAS